MPMNNPLVRIGRRKAILLIVVCVLLVLLGWPMLSPILPQSVPEAARTERSVGHVYAFIDKLLKEGRFAHSIGAHSQDSTYSLNTNIASALVAEGLGDITNVRTNKFGEPLVCDAWGQPLRMEIRDRVGYTGRERSGMSLDEERRLLIWSVGKNGLDEYGMGDDVVFHAGAFAVPRR